MKVNEETERMNPQVEDEHSAQLVLQHLCCLVLDARRDDVCPCCAPPPPRLISLLPSLRL